MRDEIQFSRQRAKKLFCINEMEKIMLIQTFVPFKDEILHNNNVKIVVD